jgi:hypothetical protein
MIAILFLLTKETKTETNPFVLLAIDLLTVTYLILMVDIIRTLL